VPTEPASTDLGGSASVVEEASTSSAGEGAASPVDDEESDEEVKPTTIHSSIEPLDSVDDGAAQLEAELARLQEEVQRLKEHEQHLDDTSWARRGSLMDGAQEAAFREYQAHKRTSSLESNITLTTEDETTEYEAEPEEEEEDEEEGDVKEEKGGGMSQQEEEKVREEEKVEEMQPTLGTRLPAPDMDIMGSITPVEEEHVLEEDEPQYETDDALMSAAPEEILDQLETQLAHNKDAVRALEAECLGLRATLKKTLRFLAAIVFFSMVAVFYIKQASSMSAAAGGGPVKVVPGSTCDVTPFVGNCVMHNESASLAKFAKQMKAATTRLNKVEDILTETVHMVENPQLEEPTPILPYRSSELVSEALHAAESSRKSRKARMAAMTDKMSRAQATRRSYGIADPPLSPEELQRQAQGKSSWSMW